MATNNSWNSKNPVQVSMGGIGVSTLTTNGVTYGNGSSAVGCTSAGTNGQVLMGATSASPSFSSITSTGGTINITSGPNSLNLDVNSMSQGTFTPTISFGGSSVGVTYSVQSGYYVRVGNCINYVINITLSSKGSSTGTFSISGFPVSAGSANLSYPTASIFINNINSLLTAGTLVGTLQSNILTVNNFSITTALNSLLNNIFFNNNTVINLTGFYMVGF